MSANTYNAVDAARHVGQAVLLLRRIGSTEARELATDLQGQVNRLEHLATWIRKVEEPRSEQEMGRGVVRDLRERLASEPEAGLCGAKGVVGR